MSDPRGPDMILRDIAAIRVMERGKLSKMRGSGGRAYYNLQAWVDGKNRCDYVPARDVEVVRQAVDNYALFRKLVKEYVGVVEHSTREARQRGEDPQKRGSAKEPPQRLPRR